MHFPIWGLFVYINFLTKMLHLRPATIADLALLKHWDEQPHLVESDPNDDWE